MGAEELTAGEQITVGVLLTQVADAQSLAAACALNKFAVDAVPSPIGAYAVLRDLVPGRPEALAKAFSALVQTVPVILITATSGQMSAQQWEQGELSGKLPVALVLDGAPHELEDLLLGSASVAELDGVVDSAKISKFKAMRMLAASARAYKAKVK